MRIVEKATDLEGQMKTAQSEAQSAFGDRSVFIEKFVTKPMEGMSVMHLL